MYAIYTVTGQTIASGKGVGNVEISLKQKGVYLVRLNNKVVKLLY